MTYTQQGSILLIVLLVISMFTMLLMTSMRSAGYMQDITQVYVVQEQQYRAIEGLLYYGISIGTEGFEHIMQSVDSEHSLSLVSWPLKHYQWHGTCTIKRVNTHIAITATIYAHTAALGTMQCNLVKQDNTIVLKDMTYIR